MPYCRYYEESKFTSKCLAADHHYTDCGGDRDTCDKEPAICLSAIWQGSEAFCRIVMETRECGADQDFCEIRRV